MLVRVFLLQCVLAVSLANVLPRWAEAQPSPNAGATASSAKPLPVLLLTPTPAKTPAPVIVPVARGVVPTGKEAPYAMYVFGRLTDDPTGTTNKLVSALVEKLQKRELYGFPETWVIPEPSWTLPDFVKQCNEDQVHTLGGFMVTLDSDARYTKNNVISQTSRDEITAHALYAQCDLPRDRPPAPKTTPTPKVGFVWFSRSQVGFGNVTIVTPLQPLALLLGLGSLVTPFIPAKTISNTTTISQPPVTNSTMTSSSFNPSSSGALATGLLTGFLGFSSSQVLVPTGDLQAWRAVGDAIGYIGDTTRCYPIPWEDVAKGAPLLSDAEAAQFRTTYASNGWNRAPFCNSYPLEQQWLGRWRHVDSAANGSDPTVLDVEWMPNPTTAQQLKVTRTESNVAPPNTTIYSCEPRLPTEPPPNTRISAVEGATCWKQGSSKPELEMTLSTDGRGYRIDTGQHVLRRFDGR